MSLENPCVYKQESSVIQVQFEPQLWFPVPENFCNATIVLAICGGLMLIYDEIQAVCLPDPSGFIWCLGGGDVGLIWPIFF